MIRIEMLSFKGSTSLSRFDDLSICAYASLTTAFALLYINDPYPTPPKISRKNGIKMNHFIDFLLERFLLLLVFCSNSELISIRLSFSFPIIMQVY